MNYKAVSRRMTFHLTLGLTFDSLIASPIHGYDPTAL
jgi:hypothetical protein